MIAISIIHGGPGPTFFTSAVVDYLVEEKISPDVCDISDLDIQSKVKMVCIMFSYTHTYIQMP